MTHLSNVEGDGRGAEYGSLQGMTGTTNVAHNNPDNDTELQVYHK